MTWRGPFRILTLVLLIQAVAFYAVAWRRETVPAVAPLSEFPMSVEVWSTVREFPLEKEVQDVLRADDTLNRVYVRDAGAESASLFIAFFKTQRYGQSPHSPKNCLPGAGWEPTRDRRFQVSVPGRTAPLLVNEYVVERGNEQSLALYWYQSHGRAIASEFEAKFWLVADAVRYRRSDTALVRIIVPVNRGDIDRAEATAVDFTRTVYPQILRQFPQ